MLQIVWTLGDVIVKLRKARRWGRKRLVRESRLSYATITRLETNKEMKEASIRSVAKAFNLDQASLYELIPAATPAADAETRERDRIWKRLPEDSRRYVLGVMQTYEPAPSEASQEPEQIQPLAHEGRAGRTNRGTK